MGVDWCYILLSWEAAECHSNAFLELLDPSTVEKIIQGLSTRQPIGCVTPHSGFLWPRCNFTQPSAQLFYHPCVLKSNLTTLVDLCAVVVVEHPLRVGGAHGVLHDVAGGEDAGEGDAAEGEDPFEHFLVV